MRNAEIVRKTAETDVPRAVCDYLSSMTDRYAVDLYTSLFIPKSWGTGN